MKILFSDLDNTLLTEDKRISDNDLNSIHRMMKEGHQFVITTGRPLNSVMELAEQYDLIAPGFLVSCFNGSLIYDCYNQKTIQQNTVPFEYAKYIFEQASKEGLHVHTYSETNIIADHQTEELDYYLARIHMPPIIDHDFAKHLNHEPWKLIVMSFESRQRLIRFQKDHARWQEGKLTHTYSCDFMLEYSTLGSSKGSSVLALADYFNVPIEDTIAVGDEENDLSMIEAAGIGVAMVNASDDIKAHANYITEHDYNNSPITELVNKFVLI